MTRGELPSIARLTKRPARASAGSSHVAASQNRLRFHAATMAKTPMARNSPPISARMLAAPIAPTVTMPRASASAATSNQCWYTESSDKSPIIATRMRDTASIG
ncbi:hypothetical protein [Sphingorhabdus sp.]|uniref:hypothetical protein n=1 Tax=Sphingorhabdus sp. TaxID=1902408 RepID=UPI0035AEC686|nr:hypothetical protein [Sphingomonadaceae bacterium]